MKNKKRKILIVDDDEEIRNLYVDVFKNENYEVIEAFDGIEGIDMATKNIPDVIFTGIIMPRMDGFGLIENLSKNIVTREIPIVISSHMGREEDREKAIKMGIKNFFVVGMISPREIVSRVNALFNALEYRLKINKIELDAFRFNSDLNLGDGFACPKCNAEMILVLKVVNLEKKEFEAKIICPKCDE
jgi:DNA-binding response OmpR family regulator